MSISKEIFGIEKIEPHEIPVTFITNNELLIKERNKIIDEIDKFELSEKELLRIIQNYRRKQLSWPSTSFSCVAIAKSIIKNKSKIFVRKND